MSDSLPQLWNDIPLGIVARVQGGFAFRSGDFVDDGVPIIRMSDLRDGHLDLREAVRVPNKVVRSLHEFRLEPGDLLVGMSGSLTNYAIVRQEDLPAYLNQRVGRVLLKEPDSCDYRFLTYVLRSSAYERHVDIQAAGAAQRNVSAKQIEQLRFPLPPPSQQRKIAKILTTVDNLIEKTEALIAKHQAIKQGMMHNLFTRGVDKHGHLRPSYDEAPELYKESELGWVPKKWAVERFGDACEKVSVGIATSTTEHFRKRGVPLLRNQNVLPTGIRTDDLLYISTAFDEINKTKRLRYNDIVTMRTGYPGRSALVPKEMAGWQTFTTLISHPDESKYLPEFMVRQINSDVCMSQIRALQGGGAQQNLNVGWIVNMRVVCPALHEQEVVANRLEAVDRKIRQEQMLRGKYAATKTGLMQDLLTGKVRVKVDEAEEVIVDG